MSSVNEILVRLHLSRKDLNNLSTSQLKTIFLDLTVKEISLLCRVSRKFDRVCEDESFWKTKVADDYGIEKKYGSTWRATARKMDEINMINLNSKWFSGKTYKQILDEALQQEYSPEFILDLQEEYLLPYANNSIDDVFDLEGCFDDEGCQEVANKVFGRDYTEDELDDIFYINNRQMTILNNTISESQVYEKDPIRELMHFSSLPKGQLIFISY